MGAVRQEGHRAPPTPMIVCGVRIVRIVRTLWNAVHDAPTFIIPEHQRPAHPRYTVWFTLDDSEAARSPATSTIAPVSCVVGAMRAGATSDPCSLVIYRIIAYTALLDRLDSPYRLDAARLFFGTAFDTPMEARYFQQISAEALLQPTIDEVARRCFRGAHVVAWRERRERRDRNGT